MIKLLFFFILVASQSLHVYSNSLTVVLDSKWSNTPFIAEASEYFASISNDYFWKYFDHLKELKDLLSLDNTEMINYDVITKVSKKLLTSGENAILKLSLSLRTYSPSIEMNQQLDAGINCSNKLYFVKFGKDVLCDFNEIKNYIDQKKFSINRQLVPLYRTDKVYPIIDHISRISKDAVIVILYGDLRDSEIYGIHELLKKFAQNKNTYYVFRHRIKVGDAKARLSGYGVELAIKSTEYRAVDDTKLSAEDGSKTNKSSSDSNASDEQDDIQGFDFKKLKELHPESSSNLDSFKEYLMKSGDDIRPLKPWEVQELSLKASQLIVNGLDSNQALEILRDVSQNYPVRASYLASVPLKSSLKHEISQNQALLEGSYGISPGQSLVLFNGYALSQDLDIYEIVDLARREMNVMTRLFDFGLMGNHISDISNIGFISDSSDSANPSGSSKSQFLLDIRSAPIKYVNDLEKDSRYNSWPKSLNDLLTPTYPGVMRRIAKNMFNCIAVLNPALADSRDIVKFMEAFVIHNAPIRMGFLWAVDPEQDYKTDAGRALIRAFNFVNSEKDNSLEALGFITDYYSSLDDEESISVESVKKFLKSKHPDLDNDIVFGEASDYDDNVQSSWKFLHESGIVNKPRPFLIINGMVIESKILSEYGFEDLVVSNVLRQTQEFQRLLMENKLSDQIPILEQILSSDEYVVKRMNERILDVKNKRFVSFTKSLPQIQKDIQSLPNDQVSTLLSQKLKYFVKNDDFSIPYHVTTWLVVDIQQKHGRQLLIEALKWSQLSSSIRLAIVQNPSESNRLSNIQKALFKILEVLPSKTAKKVVIDMISNETETVEDNLNSYLENHPLIKEKIINYPDLPEDYLLLENRFVRDVLNSEAGSSMIVTNGKILGPFNDEGSILLSDFRLLERTCVGSYKLLSKLQSIYGKGAAQVSKISELTMKIYATLVKDYETTSATSSNTGIMSLTKKIEVTGLLESEQSVFSLMGHSSKPAFDIVAILDPLSRTAQKVSHILITLKATLNLNVKIVLNPKHKLSEPPLKSFYRFVLDPSPILSSDENVSARRVSTPKAHFTNLPSQPLLTVGLEPIHNWLVQPIRSVYDLDNLRLADVPSRKANAQFELEHLLLEGHCVDMNTGQPPRGLQFVLAHDGSVENRAVADTIVMANLGYFQLKANPGAWNLKLREGKSKDIYDIIDHEFTDDDIKSSSDVIAVINNFRSKIIRVKVNKKPNKVNEQLLSESKLNEETASIWQSISNAFGKKTSGSNETINIFSVASGHLYERFLRIMMISVLKHTKNPVKFWFLKNYLSPTFKQFIPHMAKKYGFEYDLVQYKWPRWLHEQTEKQRLIWGYKILFLDVLFPLNISKIIFVDADQIVRTDLKELVDLDLEGAPYGYTPFCSSRREMDGFRFWKTGYWNMHLAGRPYHISALYVVDLHRFRLMAAGDRLRGQYHGLSQDPNSLSNLDQDLPNNMIHQVPIKSLPQEWLWCETWCSDEEKKRAKTIDLCNNPQTKEPKLSAAMRIVPEWKSYDEEIKQLWRKVYPDTKFNESQKKDDKSDQSSSAPSKDIPKQDSSQSHTEL